MEYYSFENILKKLIQLDNRVEKLEERIKSCESAISYIRAYGTGKWGKKWGRLNLRFGINEKSLW